MSGAQAVTGLGDIATLDAIDRLRGWQLLSIANGKPDEPRRFRLYESIRMFADAQLGDDRQRAYDAHATVRAADLVDRVLAHDAQPMQCCWWSTLAAQIPP